SIVGRSIVDYEWAVKLNRYALEVVGLWPEDYRGKKKFFATLRVVVILILLMSVMTVPVLCILIVNRNNLIIFLDDLGYAIPLVISHIKFVVMYKHKKRKLAYPIRTHNRRGNIILQPRYVCATTVLRKY
ncbi:uncharacterized protein LOC143185931, partial [Calliopsis andreniformis]|uniref:uncharacterized protein LOC143185931 n=1 Tax=Calliopsis andreniformis TaxID=337506 RepID=UPI003FCE43C4